MGIVQPGSVFIRGTPKSGTTWLEVIGMELLAEACKTCGGNLSSSTSGGEVTSTTRPRQAHEGRDAECKCAQSAHLYGDADKHRVPGHDAVSHPSPYVEKEHLECAEREGGGGQGVRGGEVGDARRKCFGRKTERGRRRARRRGEWRGERRGGGWVGRRGSRRRRGRDAHRLAHRARLGRVRGGVRREGVHARRARRVDDAEPRGYRDGFGGRPRGDLGRHRDDADAGKGRRRPREGAGEDAEVGEASEDKLNRRDWLEDGATSRRG